jgi:hypothetical protein
MRLPRSEYKGVFRLRYAFEWLESKRGNNTHIHELCHDDFRTTWESLTLPVVIARGQQEHAKKAIYCYPIFGYHREREPFWP